jgi:hypothetical protein
MCSIGLNFEYSRMRVPSLSSGCEIAQFLFATWGHRHRLLHRHRHLLLLLLTRLRQGCDPKMIQTDGALITKHERISTRIPLVSRHRGLGLRRRWLRVGGN